MTMDLSYLALLALLLPLAGYLWVAARTSPERVSTPAGYFIAYRQLGGSPYADSSLAYGFQVATLFPFLYWGTQGLLLPAVLNALAWGGGILLFRRQLPQILSALDRTNGPMTLHGLLGDFYGSATVRKLAALITIVGMLGLALAEAYWGMQILTLLVPADTPAHYALTFGALLVVLTYIWLGGAWASYATDRLQLYLAYAALLIVTGYLVYRLLVEPTATPASAVSAAMVVVAAVGALLVRRRVPLDDDAALPSEATGDALSTRTDDQAPSLEETDPSSSLGSPPGVRSATRVFSALGPPSIGAMVVLFLLVFLTSLQDLDFRSLTATGEVGPIGVGALIVLGLGFQFVDMSAWQRLQSLGGDQETVHLRAKNGLLRFAVESPFTWLLCLALGSLMAASIPGLQVAADPAGPLASFPRILLEAGSPLAVLVALFFMIAVMAIMLSTIDSAILAVMYAFVADWGPKGISYKGPGDSSTGSHQAAQAREELHAGKRAALWWILAACGALLVTGALLERPAQLIAVLVGFYGAMLSLLPSVLKMLGRGSGWSGESVALGIALGALAGVALAFGGLFHPVAGWFGVFVSPVIAAMVPAVAAKIP